MASGRGEEQREAARTARRAGVLEDIPARQLLRPAVLVLLKEKESHGYELVARLTEFGFEVPDFAWVYRSLRVMEDEGLVTSSWGTPVRGPARRIYGLTDAGHEELKSAAASLVQQRKVIGELVARYRRLVEEDRRSHRQRKALVVEDDHDVRHTLWILLERRGWQIDEAADGETALSRWSAGVYGLIVLDYRMPGLNGLEVARELRARGATEPILLYSAYLHADVESEASDLHVRCIEKGDFTELFEVVSQFEEAKPSRARRP